jgi:hypothetical protein
LKFCQSNLLRPPTRRRDLADGMQLSVQENGASGNNFHETRFEQTHLPAPARLV